MDVRDQTRRLPLVHIHRRCCTLVSRKGHVYKWWPHLNEEIAQSVRENTAIFNGEI